MKRIALVFLLLFCIGLAKGQFSRSIREGYAALKIYDYFKAKRLFYLANSKRACLASAYGLSSIYGRNDNPFYNADSASKYAHLCSYRFMKQPGTWNLPGTVLDSVQIRLQLQHSIQLCFKQALATNTSEAWDRFLEKNPLATSAVRTEAIYRRDELDFNAALSKFNSQHTLHFIKTHPQSSFYLEAALLLERQIYDESCPQKSAEELNRFLRLYPGSHMRNTALEELYGIYRQKNDSEGLKSFVSNYPEAPQANEAWKLLFSLSVRSYTDEELIRFLALYPEFPLRNSILKELRMSSRTFFPFTSGDYKGYIDTSGVIAIPPLFDEASTFSEELALVSRNDSLWFINKLNENVFQQIVQEGYGFNSGVAPVKFNGSWKFINRQGQVISPDYEEINELSDQLYVLRINQKFGAIDRFGQSRIEARFDYLGQFKHGAAPYREGDLYGFVTSRSYVHKAEFDWISEFDENKLAVFRQSDVFGLIHQSGEVLLPAMYNQILKAPSNVFILVKDNRYGFFSAGGCFITALEFDYAMEKPPEDYVQNDWFRLIKNKQIALMDANGALRVNYGVYDDCGFFNQGLLWVKKKKKYAYVDRKLQTAIPYLYTWAEDFKDGIALVKKGEYHEAIDLNGKTVFASDEKIRRLPGKYFLITNSGNQILVNSVGAQVLDQIEQVEALNARYWMFTLKNGQIKLLKL